MSAIGDDPKDLRIDSVAPGDRTGASEQADAVSGAEAAQAAGAAEGAGAVTDMSEIAQALGAGTLDPAAAKAMLIDQAVAAQVPPGASSELIAEIRAEVAALLEADPVLDRLLQS